MTAGKPMTAVPLATAAALMSPRREALCAFAAASVVMVSSSSRQ
jgi:hypothetical protein